MAKNNIYIDWNWVKRQLLKKEKIPTDKKHALKSELGAAVDECIAKARALAKPEVVSVRKKVLKLGGGSVRLEGGPELSGNALSSYIKDAGQACLFLATIGAGVENAATGWMKNGDHLRGYLIDSIGSFAVESLAENFEQGLRSSCAAKKMSVSMRLSPGYCDWPIEEQAKLSRAIGFSGAGVRLTESFMMVPRKSISGLVGIGPKGLFSKTRSQCTICDRNECGYRRSK